MVISFLARKVTLTALAFSPGERGAWRGSILNRLEKSMDGLTDVSGMKLQMKTNLIKFIPEYS